MKRYLKILRKAISTFLITIALPSLAQEVKLEGAEQIFLPEIYVKDIISTHHIKTTDMFRQQPIETVVFIKGKPYIKTYGGKYPTVPTRTNSEGEIEFPSIKQLLNLKYFQEDDFENARFFLKKLNKNTLSLYIIDENNRNTISFISEIDGYRFENPEVTYVKLLLKGNYLLINDSEKSDVTFDLKGNIFGHDRWANYVVEGVHKYSTRGNHRGGSFKSIILLSKTGDEHLNLAFTYYPDTGSWEGFAYETIIGNEIDIKGKRIIKLSRK